MTAAPRSTLRGSGEQLDNQPRTREMKPIVAGADPSSGRPINWPRPTIIGDDAVAEATRQISEGWRAALTFPRTPCTPPIAWGQNPFRDKSWMMRSNCLQMTDAYFFAFDESRDARWMQAAADVLEDWIDYHIIAGSRSYLAWADMAAGYRALKLGRLMFAAYQGIYHPSQQQLNKFIMFAEKHIAFLTNDANISHGNHGVFQMHGLKVLVTMFPNLEESESAKNFCAKKIDELIRRQFNEEGFHLEHSPQYHIFMLEFLRDLGKAGWHSLEYFDNIRTNAEEAVNWISYPDGGLVRVGDTGVSRPCPKPTVSAQPDVETQLYTFKLFSAGGVAVCRSGREMLYATAAYHSKCHKHADHFNFEFWGPQGAIFWDTGAEGYKAGPIRSFCLSTQAHNVVQIDGQNFRRDGTDAFGSAITCIEAFQDRIEIIAETFYKQFYTRHRRIWRYWPGRRLEIIDDLEADVVRRFVLWNHLHPDVEIAEDDGVFQLLRNGFVEGTLRMGPTRAVSKYRGETEPTMAGWCAVRIGAPLVPRWSIAAETAGLQAHFETICVFGPDPEAGFGGAAIRRW